MSPLAVVIADTHLPRRAKVFEHSTITEHTIGDLKIGERTGAIVLAIRTTEGNFDTTPSADDRLRASDTLIVLGSRGQIERLEQLMRGM
jgi:K+/H+ antiporter YhaU regulatory subunit KhtT